MDHIETKILNSYTIQEAAQNMVFAARLFFMIRSRNLRERAKKRLLRKECFQKCS